ncbi:MAG: M10 family metallopeptidase C-terminal domain-containing protein, partial [Rhodobacteraceae bacterium]|nr:M10 family metallopeptidase C-terminal domain-containing protein [Paracoccaceae bacterium]
AGNDTLIGGAGKDIMKGGTGADVFVFNDISDSNSGQIDRIKDFETGIDTVDLAGIAAGELTFLGTSDFTATGTAELRYFTNARDNTFLLADIDGDGTIDMKIFFKGIIDFTADDFIL